MYSTRTRVHARIPNRHPREEKRACRTSRRTCRRGSSVSGSWQAERGSRRTRQLSLEDPRAEVGEDVRVAVVPMEFQLKPINRPIRSDYRLTDWFISYTPAGERG